MGSSFIGRFACKTVTYEFYTHRCIVECDAYLSLAFHTLEKFSFFGAPDANSSILKAGSGSQAAAVWRDLCSLLLIDHRRGPTLDFPGLFILNAAFASNTRHTANAMIAESKK